ncbi:MAG: hypothetical protein RJA57_471 [Bacteroidota bacterium]|jgi:integrase/recombinase XerC
MSSTNSQLLQPFLDYLTFERRYSSHTREAYRADLTSFIDYLQDVYQVGALAEVKAAYIRSWLAAEKERGLTSKTLNRKISSLKSFFKHAVRTGLMDASPMYKIIAPKVGSKLPSFVKEEEAVGLLDMLERGGEDWKGLNARLLITVFYATGMRLSELLNLREQQIDLPAHQVKVVGKGNKERILPLEPSVCNLIRNYVAEKRKRFGTGASVDAVLLVTERGRKLYPKYAWKLVNEYLSQASTLDKRSPHVLRHSFATHLMNNGASLNAVKELLGHSSLAATQVYTHTTIEKLRDVHRKAHPRS